MVPRRPDGASDPGEGDPGTPRGPVEEGLVDLIPDAALLVDERGRVLVANEAAAVAFCSRREGLAGVELGTHVRLDGPFVDAAPPAAGSWRVHRGCAAFRLDGTAFAADVHLRRAPNAPDGDPTLVVVRDVPTPSDEDRLRGHLANVVRSSHDAIISVDLDGRVTSWNPAAEALYGYTASEMAGEPIGRIVPSDRVGEEAATREAVRRGESFDVDDARRVRKDGRVVHVGFSVLPLRDAHGNVIGASIIQKDAGSLRREEARLRRDIQEKEVLLQEIHHRVKNNLQVIASLLNMQSRTLRDEQAQKALRESRNRVKSMALVHEILYRANEFSRVDLGSYIEQLTEDVGRAYGYGPRVRLHVENRGPAVEVSAAVNLGLIANELISNALKHAFPDGRRGTVRVTTRTRTDGSIRLQVADDGVGMPRDVDLTAGRTLGMQVVDTLVKQMKADMSIERRAGTTIRIEVPVGDEPPARPSPPQLSARDRARRLL